LCLKPVIPFPILPLFYSMLTTIKFDNQFSFKVDKIYYVSTYNLLTTKLETFQLLIS